MTCPSTLSEPARSRKPLTNKASEVVSGACDASPSPRARGPAAFFASSPGRRPTGTSPVWRLGGGVSQVMR